MSSLELTTFINTLSNAIACELSDEELDLMASVFSQIGDTLSTISAHRAFCDKLHNKSD